MTILSRSILSMDTTISIKVITESSIQIAEKQMEKALSCFQIVEKICSRFDPQSEVMLLAQKIGTPLQVSRVLFETVSFAYEIAELTQGIFDPTVGKQMEDLGFNRHYLTRQNILTPLIDSSPVSYKNIIMDREQKTLLLEKPLILDLGAVAKGYAVDLAAKELQDFESYSINAGGDLYLKGLNELGEPWKVGIQHPYEHERILCTLQLTDTAVCTSGSYERKSKKDPSLHHFILPKTRLHPDGSEEWVSSTVIAPYAMMADALATAAFIQGVPAGVHTIEELDVDGIFFTSTLKMYTTQNMKRYLI